MFVPGTGTNFIPRLFTNGAAFVAAASLARLEPPPIPEGVSHWLNSITENKAMGRRLFMMDFLLATMPLSKPVSQNARLVLGYMRVRACVDVKGAQIVLVLIHF
jgi:hypothetical protein